MAACALQATSRWHPYSCVSNDACFIERAHISKICQSVDFLGDILFSSVPCEVMSTRFYTLSRKDRGVTTCYMLVETYRHSSHHIFLWHRYSLTAWARNKWIMSGAARGDAVYAGVTKQLEILGADHVGYGSKSFVSASGVPFSVVGARPFSKVQSLTNWRSPINMHMSFMWFSNVGIVKYPGFSSVIIFLVLRHSGQEGKFVCQTVGLTVKW